MIKITLYCLAAIAAIAWIAEPKISLYPFKIQLARGWFALGMALIGIGIGLVRYQGYKDGANKGIDAAFTYMKELVKKEEPCP